MSWKTTHLLYFRLMIITLTGFMGVGKSTIAARLAQHLFCRHADLDHEIETGEQMSVEEIFATRGEAHFRHLEERYLSNIIDSCTDKVMVLSLGGGAIMSPVNQKLLKDKTYCIYLRASIETMAARLSKARKSRPLLKDKSEDELRTEIERLFQAREPGYEAVAKLVVNADKNSVHDILCTIINSI